MDAADVDADDVALDDMDDADLAGNEGDALGPRAQVRHRAGPHDT